MTKEQMIISLLKLIQGERDSPEKDALEHILALLTHMPEIINCPVCGRMHHIENKHECEVIPRKQ